MKCMDEKKEPIKNGEKGEKIVDASFVAKDAKKPKAKKDNNATKTKRTFGRWGRVAPYVVFPILAGVGIVGLVKGCGCDYTPNVIRNKAAEEADRTYSSKGDIESRLIDNGRVIYEGIINNHKLKYVEDARGKGLDEPYNVLFIEVRGEKYELYDLKDKSNLNEDFSNDGLERIVDNVGRVNIMEIREANNETDYGRKVANAFEKWNKFYGRARTAIAGKLNEKIKSAAEEKEMEFKRVYNSVEEIAPRKADN